MQLSTLAFAVLPALAAAQSGAIQPSQNATATITATTVVTALTTYCPEPTVLTFNGECYTATKAMSLTITNCPCTVTTAMPAGSLKTNVPVSPQATTKGTSAQSTYAVTAGAAGKSASYAALAIGLGGAVLGLVVA